GSGLRRLAKCLFIAARFTRPFSARIVRPRRFSWTTPGRSAGRPATERSSFGSHLSSNFRFASGNLWQSDVTRANIPVVTSVSNRELSEGENHVDPRKEPNLTRR